MKRNLLAVLASLTMFFTALFVPISEPSAASAATAVVAQAHPGHHHHLSPLTATQKERQRKQAHHRAARRAALHRAAVLRTHYGVTSAMMAQAQRVSVCEEGGNWHFVGSVFDGGIGWTLANWQQFRRPEWPTHMHDASKWMQANALFRFIRHYGIGMPDQDGVCRGY